MSTLLVLPKPSRFDRANDKILAGPARVLCDETLGEGTYNVCYADQLSDQRTFNNIIPSHIILTGQESLDRFMPCHTLSAHRGFVWHLGIQKIVATFWPVDACDIKNYEDLGGEEDDEDAGSNSKDDAPTSRGNYRFWFQRDCAKLFDTGDLAVRYEAVDVQYHLFDNAEAADVLRSVVSNTIYFDIETHPDTNTLQCFSFAVNDGAVITCSVYDYRGQLQSSSVRLLAALARAFSRNTVVIHNSFFDLLFLALYHNIPAPAALEDTMLMQHRIFPEAEKSLAHAISLWINSKYHKSDAPSWHPRSWSQQDKLLRYNSKDVSTLRAVHRAQWRYVDAAGDDGLRDSVVQVNSSIPEYLRTSFAGANINIQKLIEHRRGRAEIQTQLGRVISCMAGYALNPGSPPQMANYFVDRMGYDVLKRTETGGISVDEAVLHKYLLRYHNPIIKAMLKWKRADKVHGELGFKIFTPIHKRS